MATLSDEYSMMDNYPNPFNPSTTIEFELAEQSFVLLKVYNQLDQEVATLIGGEEMEAGVMSVGFDASVFASGVYYYHLVARGLSTGSKTFIDVKKMILVR